MDENRLSLTENLEASPTAGDAGYGCISDLIPVLTFNRHPAWPPLDEADTYFVYEDKFKLCAAFGIRVAADTFDIAFIPERWLRHRHRLAENASWGQKILSIFAIVFAIMGAVGLIILTCLNDVKHGTAHDTCLVIFIGGYIISAIFICAEYQRLGTHHRQYRVLRMSFWMKLAFIFVEVGLAIAFGVLGDRHHYNSAAVVEWKIALIYTFYVWSFAIDFIPAVRTKHFGSEETEVEMASAIQEESIV